jgi:hypothetical protein
MDTTAQSIVKTARDLLVDGLGLYRIEVFPREPGPHGMDDTQRAQVVEAVQLLWCVLSADLREDPEPVGPCLYCGVAHWDGPCALVER